MAKARRVRQIGKKKNWYPILAPKLFNQQVVGETLVAEPTVILGKQLPINLMNLTGDIRKQNIQMIFKVNNIKENKLNTEIAGYRMINSSVKRLVKRSKNKVEHVFTAETADNNKLKFKILLITRNIIHASTSTDLRKACVEHLSRIVKKTPYEQLIGDIVGYKIQSGIKRHLNKIYPLRSFDIRVMQLKSAAKPEAPTPKVEAPKELKEAVPEVEAPAKKPEEVSKEIPKTEEISKEVPAKKPKAVEKAESPKESKEAAPKKPEVPKEELKEKETPKEATKD